MIYRQTAIATIGLVSIGRSSTQSNHANQILTVSVNPVSQTSPKKSNPAVTISSITNGQQNNQVHGLAANDNNIIFQSQDRSKTSQKVA